MRPIALAASVALLACIPAQRRPSWTPTEPAFVAAQAGFELVPPPAWMRLSELDAESLVITRDGVPLQRIVVSSSEIGKPVGIGESKRAVTAGMSTQELAELVIDDLRATEALTDVRVLEDAPAELSGKKGFRVVAAYRDANGLRRRDAVYGVVEAGRLYRLFYIAPERLYYPRDLPIFEEVARSFRLRPPVPPSPAAPAPAGR